MCIIEKYISKKLFRKGSLIMTLVILAAGMGSRYGGLKQIEPIGENGEFIIDYSVYDAILNGFNKVVFVIKQENLNDFRNTVGKRFENKIKVEYAFQRMDDIPNGHTVPEGRIKPWGTAHALLAARHVVNEPFAVINADDFYGRSAYRLLSDHFSRFENDPKKYCMVGYVLKNTLTENGTVSRGICRTDEHGILCEVTERTAIRPCGDHAVYTENSKDYNLPLDSIASMNCWGFNSNIFEYVWERFDNFLSSSDGDPLKREYYLPFAVTELMQKGLCTVNVYSSEDAWYGVTYQNDRESVKKGIRDLIEKEIYPNKLN